MEKIQKKRRRMPKEEIDEIMRFIFLFFDDLYPAGNLRELDKKIITDALACPVIPEKKKEELRETLRSYEEIGEREKDDEWLITHRKELEEAFEQKISKEELVYFDCYNTFEEMLVEFEDEKFINKFNPYIMEVAGKWIIKII